MSGAGMKGPSTMRNKLDHCMLVFIYLTVAAAVLGLLASCSETADGTDKARVVVTILPQAEFVEKVGGEKVHVTVMVEAGASPHAFAPKPSQMKALAQAEIYAKVGSGLEFELTWMDRLMEQNTSMLVVDCSEGIQLREVAGSGHADEHNEHGDADPHVWMSPRNAVIMVRNIAAGLMQIDPENADHYRRNRDTYIEELNVLDRDIARGLAGMPNRTFMVYHPSFGYFADAYGLTMLPVEAEGKEPTAAAMADLIRQAKEHNVRVIFTSPQYSERSAEVIANEIGGSVVSIDSLEKDYVANLYFMLEKMIESLE